MTPVPTVVEVDPIYLDNASLVIDGLDYAAAASKIECTPSTSTATFRGMKKGATFTHTSVESWALGIDFAQDYDAANSFSNLCFEHQGEEVEVEFAPREGGQAWKVLVQLVPGGIGGQGAAHATSSISLGVKGQPSKVTAPAGE